MTSGNSNLRNTSQEVIPTIHNFLPEGKYDIYPGFPLPNGKIFSGFESLAKQIIKSGRNIVIDGYGGIFWQDFRDKLNGELEKFGQIATWQNVESAMFPPSKIKEIINPFLGGTDPVFGKRYTGGIEDLFDPEKLRKLKPNNQAKINILYGCGATLAGWKALVVYLDLPKNEIQFRSRAGSITNLGMSESLPPKEMYKQFYFVDWVVLNRHKASILAKIDLMVDVQRIDEPVWMSGSDLRAGLDLMAHNYFRVRPWFEPGPWGGQWIRNHITQLPQDVPNYAWSFELIVPENGLLFESSGILLEVSFDTLMFQNSKEVMGNFEERFSTEFPIRFDFLDTFEGGNLSVQCHPSFEYIRENFGERFTQDEAYYILDSQPGSRVYLGFQETIDPNLFKSELEKSFRENVEIPIDKFVNSLPSSKHDLFLIPNGTIHGAGINNLVLEISTTPYIFTFKMYDWMRLDLDGAPRPLNIQRAFDNLKFERKGEIIEKEYKSHPYILETGKDWKVYHLPTHQNHFYDVHRVEFDSTYYNTTEGSPHVLSLVEGDWIILETSSGMRKRFNYAETFVIPAATNNYRLINETDQTNKVVITFLKPECAQK